MHSWHLNWPAGYRKGKRPGDAVYITAEEMLTGNDQLILVGCRIGRRSKPEAASLIGLIKRNETDPGVLAPGSAFWGEPMILSPVFLPLTWLF